jgi:hypothetical protein
MKDEIGVQIDRQLYGRYWRIPQYVLRGPWYTLLNAVHPRLLVNSDAKIVCISVTSRNCNGVFRFSSAKKRRRSISDNVIHHELLQSHLMFPFCVLSASRFSATVRINLSTSQPFQILSYVVRYSIASRPVVQFISWLSQTLLDLPE